MTERTDKSEKFKNMFSGNTDNLFIFINDFSKGNFCF